MIIQEKPKDFTMFSKWALMCMAEQFVYLNTLIYTIPVETNAEVTTILSPFNLSATVIARVQGFVQASHLPWWRLLTPSPR